MTATIDETRLNEFMGAMVGHMTGGALCFAVWLGDELGLYRALVTSPATADELAAATGTNTRLVAEWLDGQVAGRLLEHDAESQRYALSPEAEAALADETSPVFVARGMNTLASIFLDHDKILAAFRGDGALAWSDHHRCLFTGTEWFFRTGYRAYLPTEWLPKLDGVDAKLRAGARVADIGCGHGASANVIADAYPAARIVGFDSHAPSIDTARARAAEAGTSNRVSFEVADAQSYPGTFDLICFFDCLHDMGDPVGIARYAREHLSEHGTVLLVEPFALDDKQANIADNPMAALLYTASSAICTPHSLSQDVGLALGAQAGQARLASVFEQAGFTRFRRAAETPLNLILEARP